MGTLYIYKCGQCNHEVESSGKLDYGMMAVVKPYICSSCNDVVDVLVGECGSILPKEMIPADREEEFNCCPDCGKKELTEWGSGKYPCPKCENKMIQDGVALLWD